MVFHTPHSCLWLYLHTLFHHVLWALLGGGAQYSFSILSTVLNIPLFSNDWRLTWVITICQSCFSHVANLKQPWPKKPPNHFLCICVFWESDVHGIIDYVVCETGIFHLAQHWMQQVSLCPLSMSKLYSLLMVIDVRLTCLPRISLLWSFIYKVKYLFLCYIQNQHCWIKK